MKHPHRPKQTSSTDHLFEYRLVEKRKLKQAIAVTAIVMVAEIIGGFLTNSIALISDAGHMFTHSFALLISLGAILCATKPACHHRTYGIYRIEILAALFNSLFLFGVTGWIAFESIKRIIYPEPILSLPMLIVAIVGLIANFISAWLLHGTSKSDLNLRSAFLHMLADTVSSLVIIIGAVIIHFTGWNFIDPILSIGIALVILSWGWGLFKDAVRILLESVPKGISTDEVSKVLMKENPGIKQITDLHIWEITSKMYSMTVHIKLKGELERANVRELLNKIKQSVNERFDIEHTTIEFE